MKRQVCLMNLQPRAKRGTRLEVWCFGWMLCVSEVFLQQELLTKHILQTYVYPNTPKHWHKYISKLLHKNIKTISFFKLYTSNFAIHQLKILSHSSRMLKDNQQTWITSQYSAKYFIKELVGKISPVSKNMRYKGKKFTLVYQQPPQHYHFETNLLLRLNLSFEYIYFSAHSLSKCKFGRLDISSSRNDKTIFSVSYCGIFENVLHFPQNNAVTLSIIFTIPLYQSFVKFNMSLIFSLIDSLTIRSLRKHPLLLPTQQSFFFIQTKSTLHTSHVKVEHYKIVNIKLFRPVLSFVNFHDGPGVKYPSIRPPVSFHSNSVSFGTSSFQCVVLCLEHAHRNYIQYSSLEVWSPKQIEYIHTNITVSFPGQACQEKEVCMWLLFSRKGSYVNASVQDLVSSGHDNPHCFYAGLAAYDIGRSQMLNSEQCVIKRYEDKNETFEKYRNIFSQWNRMLLVIFSFKKYVSFSVKMSISITKCRPILINACSPSNIPQILLAKENPRGPYATRTINANMVVFTDTEQCYVVQSTYTQSDVISCLATLYFKHTPWYGHVMDFAINGFLRGKV